MLTSYVASGKISSDSQLTAALEFLTNVSSGDAVEIAAFESASGVGIVVTTDMVKEEIAKVIETHKSGLLEKRFVQCPEAHH